MIANLTPFRGPSADVDTVYEIGFARALGLQIFGYATNAIPFLDRSLAQFGLFDNLMIEGGIAGSGGSLIAEHADDRWRDLAVFERCVRVAASVTAHPIADPPRLNPSTAAGGSR